MFTTVVYDASAVQKTAVSVFVTYNDCVNGTKLWPNLQRHVNVACIFTSSLRLVEMLRALPYSAHTRRQS